MVFSPETIPTLESLPPGLAERGFVFGETRPFAQCHASTLLETRDGRTLVAFFAGTREGHRDVAIWIADGTPSESTAGFLTCFGPPRVAAKVAPVAHWNPVLYPLDAEGEAAGPGEIALQFKVGASIRSWSTWLARSRDGGRTFEEAAPLVAGDRGGRGAVRNKPIRLASGDWLAGASIEAWRRWDAFFDRSPNGIDGWTATERIAVERGSFVGKGLIQPALWESQPSHVHALFRTTDGRIHRSDSRDDGRSWSVARPIDVPNNNSALDVARLADGTLALACNPVPGNWAPRTPLSLLFSRDDGASWPLRVDVETGPGEFSYPALVASGASGEGLALCYTWNRRRIAFVRIPKVSFLLDACRPEEPR
jgi:predicted neuraminidase